MGWEVNAMPQLLYPRDRDPVSILQEAGWAQDWSGQVQKTSPSPEFDPRTVQPVASHYTDCVNPTWKKNVISTKLSKMPPNQSF
jgi:hypothetical protein